MAEPVTGHRPWGSYTILDEAADYKVKRIEVLPGRRLSLQRHRRRSEHWYFVRGHGTVRLGDRELAAAPGVAADIPAGTLHRVGCEGSTPLVFIEIQRGDYFGEDDIERLEDDFGRA